MILSITEVLLTLLLPFFILKNEKSRIVSLLGTTGASYAAGMLTAIFFSLLLSAGILTERSTETAEIMAYLAIALGIPLLLFPNNLRAFLGLSKEMLLAFGLLVLSVFLATLAAFLLVGKNVPEGTVLGGMAAALYTGGTPNLNAVACLFGLDTNVILMANLSDILFGGLFYVFLLFGAKKTVSFVLKPLKAPAVRAGRRGNGQIAKAPEAEYPEAGNLKAAYPETEYPQAEAPETGNGKKKIRKTPASFRKTFFEEKRNKANADSGIPAKDEREGKTGKEVFWNLLLSLAVVLFSAAAGLGAWVLKGKTEGTMTQYLVPALMIGTTVGGIAGSFFRKVRTRPGTEKFGQYFTAVFSYSIASILDIRSFGDISLRIFAFFALVTVLTFVIHLLLSRIFDLHGETMIVAATAGIYGPAFVPSVSRAIGAEELLPAGLIAGSFGYAMGTVFGVICTGFFRLFL